KRPHPRPARPCPGPYFPDRQPTVKATARLIGLTTPNAGIRCTMPRTCESRIAVRRIARDCPRCRRQHRWTFSAVWEKSRHPTGGRAGAMMRRSKGSGMSGVARRVAMGLAVVLCGLQAVPAVAAESDAERRLRLLEQQLQKTQEEVRKLRAEL